MLNNNPKNIDEMDLLLKQAFLELDFNLPKNEAMLTIISSHTLGINTSIQTTTLHTLLKLLKNKLFITMLAVSSIVITLGMLFLYESETKLTKEQQPNKPSNAVISLLNINDSTINEEMEIKKYSEPKSTAIQKLPIYKFTDRDTLRIEKMSKVNGQKEFNFKKIVAEKKNEPYAFPQLTDEEIKVNNKQKSKMIKFFKYKKRKTDVLYNIDNEKYAFIPMGKYVDADNDGEKLINKKETSVQAFYMQKTEVSNLEYRTFLFDLLIQNRKEDFLKAKPDQQQWANSNSYSPAMAEYYFSHPAYNNFPVNNISREGAEMYCKWLTDEVNKLYHLNNMVNDVRLPTVYEWKYAASSGGKYFPYPWGGPYARNSNGYFLANFYPMKDSSGVDNADILAPVTSYNPNDFGLYNMSGNVAEMVVYPKENNLPGTKGGSWMSIGYEIQINGSDKFKGITSPNVNIGFRPVITYLGRTIY